MRVPGQAYRVQLVLGDDGPRPTTESREAIIGSPNPKKSPILYKMQSNSARWPKPTRAARLQRPRTKRARMCTLARKVSTVQLRKRKMDRMSANVQLPCPKRARMCTFAREVSKRRLIRAFQLHIRTQSVQISPIRMHGGQNRRECAATLNGLGGCGKVGPASWIARAHKSNSPALSGGRIVKVAISSEVTPPDNPSASRSATGGAAWPASSTRSGGCARA